jgi:phosphoribosylformylglycinamidine synthase
VRLPGEEFTHLFGESVARAVVATAPGAEHEFAALCADRGVPATVLGVTGGASLEVAGSFAIPLAELAAAHRGTLPALFD